MVQRWGRWCSALDAAYAEARQRWEPLYEATQLKGDGEAHPTLSPDDGFADFETFEGENSTRTASIKGSGRRVTRRGVAD